MSRLNEQIKQLMEMMNLHLNPQAIKMIENEADVPADAIRPLKDYGKHVALCQAMALTKREGKTVYMTKEDHWCWNPLIGLGSVKCEPGMESFDEICKYLCVEDMNKARKFLAEFPKLPYHKYVGILIAPAQSCDFIPDVILINCKNNYQLRFMLLGIKNKTGKMLNNPFDALDTCSHTIVEPMLTGEYRIAIPDPGDQVRALADKNEIVLAVPTSRLEELVSGCSAMDKMGCGYKAMQPDMMYDFARPPFYNKLFELWNLDQGEEWKR